MNILDDEHFNRKLFEEPVESGEESCCFWESQRSLLGQGPLGLTVKFEQDVSGVGEKR